MNPTLKLALITDGITPFVTGGMQRHSANLAIYLTKAGADVTLVHCVAHDQPVPEEREVNMALFGNEDYQLSQIVGLKFPKPGKIPGHYIRNSYQYSREAFESLAYQKFDFVIAKGFTGWYYMKQKKQGMNLPPIGVKFHGYEMFQMLPSINQKLQAFLLKRPTRWNNENADYIFSYGGKITELIRKQFKTASDKIIEFTSGIDDAWIRTTRVMMPDKRLSFVFLGRYERRKGVEELNNVLKRLIEHKLDFEMHFIGPIPEDKKIKSASIVYHGLLGNKEDITTVLDKTDILLCPSHSEGMPNVILEGMARGNAVVATKVGAVECLVDERCGWLINPGVEEELFQLLNALIGLEKETILQKKEQALKRVSSDFVWTTLGIRIKDKIKELIDK